MPVFHFTLHAYRSWNTDNPKGYVKRGEGIKQPNLPLARARHHLAKHPPYEFTDDDTKFLVTQSPDVVHRRNAKLYGVTAIPTHLHLAIGWPDQRDEEDLQARLKRAFGYLLAKRHNTQGRPYFSRGGAPEKVENHKHLHYLLHEYFPKHNAPLWRIELP